MYSYPKTNQFQIDRYLKHPSKHFESDLSGKIRNTCVPIHQRSASRLVSETNTFWSRYFKSLRAHPDQNYTH